MIDLEEIRERVELNMGNKIGIISIKEFINSDMKIVEFAVPLEFWIEFETSKEFQELQRYLYDLGKRHNKTRMTEPL